MSSRTEDWRSQENIYRYYRYLKDVPESVNVSGRIYKCPYCSRYERKNYTYQQILQHACGVARTANWRSRERHLGLEMYLRRHMDPKSDYEELLVYPWMVVVANVPNKVMEDGRYEGDSGKKLKDEWTVQGYEPTKVRPLWNYKGHTGFAIVEFGKNWTGYSNAMRFATKFEMENHGKKHWKEAREKGDKLYAWIACEEDYKEGDTVSRYLKKADLKTISEIEAEDERKDAMLVCNTTESLVKKEKECQEIKENIIKTEARLSIVMRQNEETAKAYDEEMKMHMKAHMKQIESIYRDHEQLEAEREMLRSSEKSLRERENQYETENEKALLAQKKAHEDLVKLAEAHNKEKEQIYRLRTGLEKKCEGKRQLQLEVEKLRGALEVKRRLSDGGYAEVKKEMEALEEDLADKVEHLECLEDLFQTLVIKERKTTVELQDGRKEIIRCLMGRTSARAFTGVKRMGDLDLKPIVSAAKMKYPAAEAEVKAVEFHSLFEAKLRDLTWWPFKVMTAGADSKSVVDEEDHRLKIIKNEWGDEVYDTVLTALTELNDYNPNGRYPVPELWHFKEDRKATLGQGVEFVLRLWKTQKRKRN